MKTDILPLLNNLFKKDAGNVFDMCKRNSDKAVVYPILGLDGLIKKSDAYLTTENGTRILTKLEKERYFISDSEN